MTQPMHEYAQYLIKYVDQCKVLLSHEQVKRQALLSNDIDGLEKLLQSQQADNMKLKNMEQRRMELQAAAGFSGQTAEEIISSLGNSEEGQIFASILTELKNTVHEISELNTISMKIADSNLKMFDKLLHREQEGGSVTYSPGTNRPVSKSAFKETI